MLFNVNLSIIFVIIAIIFVMFIRILVIIKFASLIKTPEAHEQFVSLNIAAMMI